MHRCSCRCQSERLYNRSPKAMKSFNPIVSRAVVALTVALVCSVVGIAQQPAPQQVASRFDVTNYRIEAQLIPEQHMLRAGADITFVPLDATRSVVFELNGSLKF